MKSTSATQKGYLAPPVTCEFCRGFGFIATRHSYVCRSCGATFPKRPSVMKLQRKPVSASGKTKASSKTEVGRNKMNDKQTETFLFNVESIRVALQDISQTLDFIVDTKKKTLRMVDVDRGKVYKTHLGKKLSK